MKWPAILGILIGLGLAATLIGANDVGKIAAALLGAGWGILLVIALRVPQTVASALGWRSLVAEQGPSIAVYSGLRWIREAVNNLLPVAGVGGDIVRARLLALKGVSLRCASASAAVDLSVEMASQIVFALIGVGMLVLYRPGANALGWVIAVIGVGAVIAGSFMLSQRFGLFKLVEKSLVAASEKAGWAALGDISGLHEAVVSLYHSPGRFLRSGGWHLLSWGLGVVELWAALHVLGVEAGWREALIIEALGQAIRGAAFAVPGALGVQEGGYVLVCALFGIPPQQALALSLIRRIRDLALGVPALVAWQRIEGRMFARRAAAPGVVP